MNKRKQIIVDTTLNMDYSILQENCPTTFNDRRVLRGRMAERINLTRMPKDERNKLLKQFNIPE